MPHVKYETHDSSGVREYVIWMDLNARVDEHYERTVEGTYGLTDQR